MKIIKNVLGQFLGPNGSKPWVKWVNLLSQNCQNLGPKLSKPWVPVIENRGFYRDFYRGFCRGAVLCQKSKKTYSAL